MKAHCSCPDWAVPCKHIAAVIYLIANEIDKNPFIIFNLHSYDIIGAIIPNLKKHISSIPDIENMLKKGANQAHPKPPNGSKADSNIERLKSIDFAKIPEMYESFSSLYIERPLFYLENDFKTIIIQHYKKTKKAIKQFLGEKDFLDTAEGDTSGESTVDAGTADSGTAVSDK